jgi:hypothetical protein
MDDNDQGTVAGLANVFPGLSQASVRYVVSDKVGTYHVVSGLGPAVLVSAGDYWIFNSDGICVQSTGGYTPKRYKTLILKETIAKTVSGTVSLKLVR